MHGQSTQMSDNPNHLPKAPCLAVLGTGSDVGKSVIAAALCRIFADQDDGERAVFPLEDGHGSFIAGEQVG